jgi:sialate O-acetylesterase
MENHYSDKKTIFMHRQFRLFFALWAVLLFAGQAAGKVRLPKLVGDSMVLQRDMPLALWGWADKGEKVTVQFLKQSVSTKAGNDGKWQLTLAPVAAGGPYTLTVKGSNTIVLRDVLVGDVWLCGGQSNMGWQLSWGVDNYQTEVANAQYPRIRLLKVKEVLSYQPLDDIQTDKGWQPCSPETAGTFSAVAYFFGRNLYQKYGVPIGLISSNWGGTPAEAWTSMEMLKTLPEYKGQAEALEKSTPEQLNAQFEEQMQNWTNKTREKDAGLKSLPWYRTDFVPRDWKPMSLPGLWENTVLPDYDGIVWLRKEVDLPAGAAGKDLTLMLGNPDDMDSTWFNGVKIGGAKGAALREYTIPGNLVKAGKNVITVRLVDFGGDGGIGGKPENLQIRSSDISIPLAGEWQYKSGDEGDYTAGWPPQPPNQNAGQLSVLFNSMIKPLIPMSFKGVIWYQGEANVQRASSYYALFSGLIKDWRGRWGRDFPFLFVQLANLKGRPLPSGESQLAELREAQLRTLALPNTAMAVTIDIGNPRDVHPRNKQDVGKRLALAAAKVAYGEEVVFSGPVFQSMQIEGNKIRVTFKHTGGGLTTKDKYGYVKGFALAGADKKFVWAKAYVENKTTLVVYSDEVANPVAIRYGWADNPEDVNLYNAEGLPASPFRTDTW